MTINIERVIAKMWDLQRSGVHYDLYGSRTGKDGTADCSGAVYVAINAGGGSYESWAPNTDGLHNYLLKNGYRLVTEAGPGVGFQYAKKGDVFIWGRKGQSSGRFGHTGIFTSESKIIHCNSRANGISEDPYQRTWGNANQPYSYLYRPNSNRPAQIDRNVITIYYVAGYGVKAVNASGSTINGSEYTLKHGTKWRSHGIYLLNGKPAYDIGGGWYVYQGYTDQCNAIKINYIPGYGINARDAAGYQISGTNGTFKTDSPWQFQYNEVKVINGSVHYYVGEGYYIPSKYTYGSGETF